MTDEVMPNSNLPDFVHSSRCGQSDVCIWYPSRSNQRARWQRRLLLHPVQERPYLTQGLKAVALDILYLPGAGRMRYCNSVVKIEAGRT